MSKHFVVYVLDDAELAGIEPLPEPTGDPDCPACGGEGHYLAPESDGDSYYNIPVDCGCGRNATKGPLESLDAAAPPPPPLLWELKDLVAACQFATFDNGVGAWGMNQGAMFADEAIARADRAIAKAEGEG